MARVCTVCAHPEREAIDLDVASGGAIRAIAGRYHVSRQALTRHRDDHLPELVHAAVAEQREQLGITAADRLNTWGQRLELLWERAAYLEGTEGVKAATTVARAGLSYAELMAKLEGELADGGAVEVLVTYTDDWRTGAN